MKTAHTVEAAEAQWPALLTQVEQEGQPIMICRDGVPVANLVPLPAAAEPPASDDTKPVRRRSFLDLTPHPALGKIEINYDPCEQVSDEDWMTPIK